MKHFVKHTIGILPLLFVVLLLGCKEDEITNITADTLVIDQTEVTLEPGDSVKLSAVILPENAGNRAAFWKSSGARIASINDEGWVKGLRPGATTITAIAYSNTEIRSSIPVIVNGIPDDVVSGVVGTYTGVLEIVTLGYSDNAAELTLQQDEGDFYSVRLITSVDLTNFGYGNVSINILTGVDRDGEDGYAISGEGDTGIGAVTINGTVDADGNIDLAIYVASFDVTATYKGKNTANIEEIVTGTYVGTVNAAGMDTPGIEVIIDREANKQYQLQVDATILGERLATTIDIEVLRSGDIYTISSETGTSTLGPVTITSGTITADGNLTFDIDIPALANFDVPTTATYSGQKLEKLANAVAGTYEGVVTLNNQPISATDAEITLTVVDRTTVRWTTSTQVTLPSPYGTQTLTIEESDNFTLNVSGGSGTYTLTGSGNTLLGNIEITSASKVEGKDISLTMDAGLGVPLIYTGQKQ